MENKNKFAFSNKVELEILKNYNSNGYRKVSLEIDFYGEIET